MNDDSIDNFKKPSTHPEEIFKRYVAAKAYNCPEDAVSEMCSADASISLQDIIDALSQSMGGYGIDEEIEELKELQARTSEVGCPLESDQTWRESISAEEDFDLVEFPVPDQYKLIAAYKKEGRIGSLEQAVINVCRKCGAEPEDLAKEFEANDLPTLAGAVRYIFSDRRYKYREESEDDENTVSDFKKPDWSLVPDDDFHKIWMGLSLKTQDQVISRAQRKQLSILDTLIPFLYECGEDLEKLTAVIDAASTNKQYLGFKEAENDESISDFPAPTQPSFEDIVEDYLEFENEIPIHAQFSQFINEFTTKYNISLDTLLQAIENETQPGTQYEEYDHLLFIADCLRDMLGLPLIHNYEDR